MGHAMRRERAYELLAIRRDTVGDRGGAGRAPAKRASAKESPDTRSVGPTSSGRKRTRWDAPANGGSGPRKLPFRPFPGFAIRVHPSPVRVLNSLIEDMGYRHVDVCKSSPPIVSAGAGLAGAE